jgi:hypothetical protein
MKVLTQPRTFVTGDILAPDDLNAVFLYGRDVVADVASKRWAKSILPIQCVTGVETPYTQASGALLVQRFKSSVTCVVERAFLSANMTSDAAVSVAITATSGGATPSGASVPLLSTTAAVTDATVDTEDTSADRFVLTANTEYSLTISIASGNFTLNRFDVILHVAVDRWTLAGTTSIPDFDPTLLTDASARDATVVNSNLTSLGTAAALFANSIGNGSSNVGALMPMRIQCHAFLSGTDVDLRTFTIPRIKTARGKCAIKRIYLFADMTAAGGVGKTITADLQNASGVSQASAVVSVNGVTYASGDTGAFSVTLDNSSVSAATTTDDFKLIFSNSDPANTCLRAVALLWVARG